MPWELSFQDGEALGLTLLLGLLVTLILAVLATPLAWWLARTRSRWKPVVGAVTALPLVLPPSVMGFYLLMVLGPQGPLGQLSTAFGWGILPFSFPGLILASVLYSLPFMVQPLQGAFQSLGEAPLEAAASLGASPWDRFFSVALPLAGDGYLRGLVMTFAHTLGEFGVVLMVGGSIPGVTRVASIQIYDHVSALDFAAAHRLSLVMVLLSLSILLTLFLLERKGRHHG